MNEWHVHGQTARQARVGATPAQDLVGAALTVARPVSVGLSAYHGYARDGSWLSAIVWGLLGGLLPVITPAVAVAQGFGKKAGR